MDGTRFVDLLSVVPATPETTTDDFIPATKIVSNSHLSNLLALCATLRPMDRAQILEEDTELEEIYRFVALQGDSEVPENAEDEVDFHYICFVKSHKTGHLYEMDGDKKGPVDRGLLSAEEDVLGEYSRDIVKEFIRREGGENVNFSLLVLAPKDA